MKTLNLFKQTLVASVVLFGLIPAVSTACPQLTGKYNCTVFEEEGSIEITQAQSQGITTYTFKVSPNFSVFIASDKIIADGKERSAPNSNYMRNGFYTAKCNGSVLKTDVKGDLFDEDGVKVASVVATSLLTKTPEGLQLVVNGKFDNDAFGPETVVCPKQ